MTRSGEGVDYFFSIGIAIKITCLQKLLCAVRITIISEKVQWN